MEVEQKYILDELPPQLKLNFINLYKVEIIDRLNQNVSRWNIFNSALGEEETNAFIDKYSRANTSESKKAIAEALFAKLKEHEGHLFGDLMKFLRVADSELYKIVCVDDWEKESFTVYKKVLNVLHELLPVFDIEKVVDYLFSYSFEFRRDYEPVLQRWKEKKIDDEYAKALIVRTVCIMSDGASYHLLYSIWKSSEKARDIVDKIFGSQYEFFYLQNIFEDRDGIFHIVESYQDVKEAVDEILAPTLESPYARNVLFDYVPQYHLLPLMYNTTEDDSFNLREYQRELAAPALEGTNSMICAPTGSGKTVVAAYIIRNHIFARRRMHKPAKVVFIVPTVPLVLQQEKQLKKFLGNFVNTAGIYGGNNKLDFTSLIKAVDIMVMTPQILVNFVDPSSCKYFDTDPVYIDAFSLIVLDEAHHTAKGHPYNVLMTAFHKRKYGDENKVQREMPQVVGLTASLGAPDKPKSIQDVVDHMISVCANFDARCISQVTKNVKEMKRWTANTQDEIIYIEHNNDLTRQYYDSIKSIAKELEDYLRSIDGIAGTSLIDCLFDKHTNIDKMAYMQWVAIAIDKTLPLTNLPPESMRKANKCLNYLKILHQAYLCSQSFPTKDTTECYLENFGDPNGDELERLVYQIVERKQILSKSATSECEVFRELVNVIKSTFATKNDSRIIVFLPQRIYCQIAVQIIEKYTGYKGIYVVSANASVDEGGCSPEVQLENLNKFRSGENPILFATSVADEGLDIVTCNLVIKYNYATDNIAHVQRKGRGRDRKSRSILITGDERIQKQEDQNKGKVEMVERAYALLHQTHPEYLYQKFEEAIRTLNKKRIEDEEAERLLREQLSPQAGNYDILCKGCSSFIIESSKLALCVSHHVVNDPNFWETVLVKEDPPEKKSAFVKRGLNMFGSIYCKKDLDGRACNNQIGRVVNFNKVLLPILTCSCLIFADKNTPQRYTKKAWKDVLQQMFYPPDMEYAELCAMKTAHGRPEYLEKITVESFDNIDGGEDVEA